MAPTGVHGRVPLPTAVSEKGPVAWQTLLVYFGGEGVPGERCGNCDHCKRWASQGGARAEAKAESGLAE